MKAFLLLAPLALGTVPAMAADRQIVAPGAEWATNEGPENGTIFVPTETKRLQMAFDRSLFGTDVVLVKQFAFRFDSVTNQTQVPSILYDFGRTVIQAAVLNDFNAMSGIFADNIAVGRQTLLDRDYSVMVDNPGPAGGPRGFSMIFKFDQAFRYDPKAGDLVIDLKTGRPPVTFFAADYLRSGVTTMRLATSTADATVGAGGTSHALGPITQITVADFVAVPEPASWAMLIVGFAAAGAASRRARRFDRLAA